MVAKLQGDKSASQSSVELYYPWISGPLVPEKWMSAETFESPAVQSMAATVKFLTKAFIHCFVPRIFCRYFLEIFRVLESLPSNG